MKFVPAEKRDRVFQQAVLGVLLLLLSFAVGAAAGLLTPVKEDPNARLEPLVRDILYRQGKELGWDYSTLIHQLRRCKTDREKVLAVWWLTVPHSRR